MLVTELLLPALAVAVAVAVAVAAPAVAVRRGGAGLAASVHLFGKSAVQWRPWHRRVPLADYRSIGATPPAPIQRHANAHCGNDNRAFAIAIALALVAARVHLIRSSRNRSHIHSRHGGSKMSIPRAQAGL